MGLFRHETEQVCFYMDATPWQIFSLCFKLSEFHVIGDPRKFIEYHVCDYRQVLEKGRGFGWVLGTVYVCKAVECATPGVNISDLSCWGCLGRHDGWCWGFFMVVVSALSLEKIVLKGQWTPCSRSFEGWIYQLGDVWMKMILNQQE